MSSASGALRTAHSISCPRQPPLPTQPKQASPHTAPWRRSRARLGVGETNDHCSANRAISSWAWQLGGSCSASLHSFPPHLTPSRREPWLRAPGTLLTVHHSMAYPSVELRYAKGSLNYGPRLTVMQFSYVSHAHAHAYAMPWRYASFGFFWKPKRAAKPSNSIRAPANASVQQSHGWVSFGSRLGMRRGHFNCLSISSPKSNTTCMFEEP
jgi:hypothetical protein